MATVRYLWWWLYSQGYNIYCMYLQYSRPLYLSLLPNVWKASYTVSAPIFVPYWPPYSTDKYMYCILPDPSQWFFHFGVIAWTHRLSTVDIPESTISSDARGSWQQKRFDSLHCRKEWWVSVPPSVAICFTQPMKTFLCTTTSCHFNLDPGTLL